MHACRSTLEDPTALEWSRRNGGGIEGLTASDAARILREQGHLDVQASNVGRAFRDLASDARVSGLWTTEDRRYRITPAGTDLLLSILGS